MEREECVLGKEKEKEKTGQLVWLVSCLQNREFKKQFTQMLTLLYLLYWFLTPNLLCLCHGTAAKRSAVWTLAVEIGG